jgi:hypothetical protein
MRGTFVYRNGRLVEKGGPGDIRHAAARSALPFPMIISDDMPPAEHVDGKTYTSKRGFRAVTRERGYIELGTEKQKPYVPPKPDRKAIRESLERAKARLNA